METRKRERRGKLWIRLPMARDMLLVPDVVIVYPCTPSEGL